MDMINASYSFGINGYDCNDKVCDWLFTANNTDATVFAHNGSGYDSNFMLKYCLSKELLPTKIIRSGSRISYMLR